MLQFFPSWRVLSLKTDFYFEVLAPRGLAEIKTAIDASDLGLSLYCSGFNNKSILKSNIDGIIELGMDTSTTDVMYGSGAIEADFVTAKSMLKTLSDIFKNAGFSHKIYVDNENWEVHSS